MSARKGACHFTLVLLASTFATNKVVNFNKRWADRIHIGIMSTRQQLFNNRLRKLLSRARCLQAEQSSMLMS